MSLMTSGVDNLVLKAIEYEAKGKGGVADIFFKADPDSTGFIDPITAVTTVCAFLKLSPPQGSDKASASARREILKTVGLPMIPDPSNPDEEVVKYGPFLRLFREGLERSPLVNSDKFGPTEAEKLASQRQPKGKIDLTLEEIHKLMDENLPKYYSSTTDAYLRMKPPHGTFKLNDFARFMRSIGIDLANDNDKLKKLFAEYDKNKNGHLDPWEFIECFGPSICGHVYSSTSLFVENTAKKRESRKLKEIPLTAKQTEAIIKERLPLHFKSSTKAFLAAKGGVNKRSHTIGYPEFKLWLQNMNIVVPDSASVELFKMLDSDSTGQVTCAEFIQVFGHAISGEEATNIQDAEHLSFHNTRPDKRVAVVPRKHMWTYEEVMKTLGDRMGLIHTSSTKAFMRAKRCGKTTMDYEDLHRALLNLNIDAPEHVVKRMFRELDKNRDGNISAAEFVAVFGNAINGFSGSFETKPPWFHKEMAALSNVLKNINSEERDDQVVETPRSDSSSCGGTARSRSGEGGGRGSGSGGGGGSQRSPGGGGSTSSRLFGEAGSRGGGGTAPASPASARSSTRDKAKQQQQQQQAMEAAFKLQLPGRTLPSAGGGARSPHSARSPLSARSGGGGGGRRSSSSGGGARQRSGEQQQQQRSPSRSSSSSAVGGMAPPPTPPRESSAQGAGSADDDLASMDLSGSLLSARSDAGSSYVSGSFRGGKVLKQQQQQRPRSAGSVRSDSGGGGGGSARWEAARSSRGGELRSGQDAFGNQGLDPAEVKPYAAGAGTSTKVKVPSAEARAAAAVGSVGGMPLNNIRPFYTAKTKHALEQREKLRERQQQRSKSAEPSRPSGGRPSSAPFTHSAAFGATAAVATDTPLPGDEGDEDAKSTQSLHRMSTKNLIKELRKRQLLMRAEEKEKETRRRSKSAPHRARKVDQENYDPSWETPAVRIGDESRGVKETRRMKDKLSRAKDMAKVLNGQEKRRIRASQGKTHQRIPGGQMESDYWLPASVMHEGVFHA